MEYKEGQIRIPAGCAISALISRSGKMISGETVARSIAIMHDRSNGLGGGFAGYGIYPEYADEYAFHIFYDSQAAREETERFIYRHFEVVNLSIIPTTQNKNITAEPLILRYFVHPLASKLASSQLEEREFVSRCAFRINAEQAGSYVVSCGKNMGVFKAVGYPEDVAQFYRLGEYSGYCWTAHGRYPTNTPGWWGGAHPFALLDLSVVHNGEISSYDANRRFIEMFGYACTLQTDTEVITYLLDFLTRKKGLSMTEAAEVIAAPFWSEIDNMADRDRAARLTYLRNVFAGLLVTGPFSILVGFTDGIMALNDRLKLRSLVMAEDDDLTYFASEEAAIRVIAPDARNLRAPRGGEPVIVRVKRS